MDNNGAVLYDNEQKSTENHNDRIEINVATKSMTLKVAPEAIAKRRANWKQPALTVTKGILYKYAKYVSPDKDIKEMSINDVSTKVPKDTTLNTIKYDNLISGGW